MVSKEKKGIRFGRGGLRSSVILPSLFLAFHFVSLSSLQAKGVTPLQLSLFNPLQLVDEDTDVYGVRFNLFYGSNHNLYGFDLGTFNYVDHDFGGIAAGIVNIADDTGVGLQGGVFNLADDLYGFQVGVVSYSGNLYGLQFGAINIADQSYLPMFGVLTNWARDPYLGEISAGFNQARSTPFQFGGVLNNSEKVQLQIAGGFNFSDRARLQLAALFNDSEEALLQISPGVNRASLSRFQLAGVLNQGDGRVPLQIALLGNSTNKGGVQFSLLGNLSGTTSLLQVSGVNLQSEKREGRRSGAQISLLASSAPEPLFQVGLANLAGTTPVQFGLYNSEGSGNLQLGGWNSAKDEGHIQIGVVNRSLKTRGFMVGLLNESDELVGSQFGLFNIARNATFPFTLFYNANYTERRARRRVTGFFTKRQTLFQLGLYPPAQLYSYETPVHGLRLNFLRTKNRAVNGLDLGVYNESSEARGIELGLVQRVSGPFYGIQMGGFHVTGEARGVQVGLVGIYNGHSLHGVAVSPIAITGGDVTGLQIGLLFNNGNRFLLPQIGGINMADSVPGQLGILLNASFGEVDGPQLSPGFNYSTDDTYGQIGGLSNYAGGESTLGQISFLFNRSRFAPFQIAGIGNHAVDESYFQFAGLFNLVSEEMRTAPFGRGRDPYLQLSALLNLSRGTYVQAAAFNVDQGRNFVQIGMINGSEKGHFQAGGVNLCLKMEGAQVGFVNVAGETARGPGGIGGIQIGGFNMAGDFRGFSAGLWNMAAEYHGVSFALFNYANRLHGVQIGLLNIHAKGTVPVMIGINAGEGGQ